MKTTKLSFFLPLSSLFLTFLTLLAVLSANAQVPSYVPTNGLVGWWPFNGNANDESGNGNNGTVLPGASLGIDRFLVSNSSYYFDGFDGGNKGIVMPFINLSGSDLSVSCWFQVTDTVKLGQNMSLTIFSTSTSGAIGASFNHPYAPSKMMSCVMSLCYSNNPNSWTIQNKLSWHNLTVTKSSDFYSYYIDGQLKKTLTWTEALFDISVLNIGAISWSTGEVFRGNIDDVAAFNRALTADEVLSLYNGCNVAALAVSGNLTPTQFTQETYTYPNTVGSTYNWTVTNGVIVSGQGTNSIDVMWANTGIGQISVAETNATNCTGDIVNYDVVVIPVNVEELSNSMILYPNPATTELNLQITSDLIGTDLFVFDALGKQILKQQILSTNTIINTSSFAAGNYVVKVGGGVKKFGVVR